MALHGPIEMQVPDYMRVALFGMEFDSCTCVKD